MLRNLFFSLCVLSVFVAQSQASLQIVSTNNGIPVSTANTNYVNFDIGSVTDNGGGNYTAANYSSSADPLGSIDVNITPNSQFASLPNTSSYAAPWIGLGNGAAMTTLFGNPASDTGAQDSTQYVSSGSNLGNTTNAQVELLFSSGQQYLGLLWGSVDSDPVDYNELTFYFDDNTTETINGTQVSLAAGGNQGDTGTYYVNIDSDKPFSKVVATSSKFAFEFDNLAYSVDRIVPEASTIAVWSVLSLIGVGAAYRKRAKLA
ncbi:Npun_F0296 family exosortase-dependent surface protein [Bythopirellula goksoeyrii]|uniref:PEP-CTERM protein-sorting domain-containing protein n=1 Tax=Bythopirellula goksoeyrii TaxID=1400387 RepID=A0A5B9QPG1_9BACT|nr:hypothetical protein [Bythopirellula goksoeyrii]QEG36011.1 hypothetical protein Pr1d_33200 [Bythopirellula goksoeyrii]